MIRIDIMTPDGRRAAAFLAILGGCMVQTLYLFIVTLWLRGHPDYLFYLALAGDILLLIGMTALGWAMGRRLNVNASRDGVTINDSTVDVHTERGE
jgi:hypothetical protein